MANTQTKTIIASTQDHLDIEEIVDDLVVMKDGRVCLILETSAVNFSLLSEIEQDSKISAFAGLLNSINFNLQIVIHTESVDISKYILTLEKYLRAQTNPLVKNQIQDYIEFIKNLIKRNDVLDKRFYVIIPYVPFGVKRTSPLRQVFGKEDKILNIASILDKAKLDLYQKKDGVIKLLLRMGLRSRQLNTEEIIKLFFKLYNVESGILPKTRFLEDDYTSEIIGFDGPDIDLSKDIDNGSKTTNK